MGQQTSVGKTKKGVEFPLDKKQGANSTKKGGVPDNTKGNVKNW